MRGLDSYPTLTTGQKDQFAVACRDDGVDPKTQCPLCRGRRLSTEPRYRYDEVEHSWMTERPHAVAVACHRCKLRWSVLLHYDTVRVRVTGQYTRNDRLDFTLYLDVPAPPTWKDHDAADPTQWEAQNEAADTWCALVEAGIIEVKPKGWSIDTWKVQINATGQEVTFT